MSAASHAEGPRHGAAFALTRHAERRLRQRGIDERVLDCLLRHGREEHDHRGALVVVFDRAALDAVRRLEDAALARAVEDARRVYAVVDTGGRVVTAGHRRRRVVRDRGLANLRRRARHRRG